MSEQATVKVGAYGITGPDDDRREEWRFIGTKISEAPDLEHPERITHHLYECPGGYRVSVCLDLPGDFFGATIMVPPYDKKGYLLTEDEARERFPRLFTLAGKVRRVNLDDEEAGGPRKRETARRTNLIAGAAAARKRLKRAAVNTAGSSTNLRHIP